MMLKYIEIVYIPTMFAVMPSGQIGRRALKERATYEDAERDLKSALLEEKPGTTGQVDKVFVVRETKLN